MGPLIQRCAAWVTGNRIDNDHPRVAQTLSRLSCDDVTQRGARPTA
jgi:hypothetical protein